jgi:copper(I)-binding protein
MKHARGRIASFLLAFGLAAGALAQVQVKEPWVRATIGQHPMTGAFMKIESPAKGRLVEVRSPVAGRVELHETRIDQGVAKMRQVDAIQLPAELRPGGYHVMLMSLKRELKAGETVPLELVVEGADGKRQTVAVQAPVRPIDSRHQGKGH